jgi:hypothetical protein
MADFGEITFTVRRLLLGQNLHQKLNFLGKPTPRLAGG